MHPRPYNVAEGEKGYGDGDPVSLAGLEHRLCPLLVEREGGNDGASLFSGNLGEGLATNQLALAQLEIDSGDSATETTGGVGHAFLDRAWEDLGHYGQVTPTFDPLLVEYFLQIFGGTLTSQKGKEFVGELVESHSISEEMCRTNEQIEVALWLVIFERGR